MEHKYKYEKRDDNNPILLITLKIASKMLTHKNIIGNVIENESNNKLL
jgi:hypothetical protein